MKINISFLNFKEFMVGFERLTNKYRYLDFEKLKELNNSDITIKESRKNLYLVNGEKISNTAYYYSTFAEYFQLASFKKNPLLNNNNVINQDAEISMDIKEYNHLMLAYENLQHLEKSFSVLSDEEFDSIIYKK